MNAFVHCEPQNRDHGALRPVSMVDPLDHDSPADEVVVASRRALCRIATVAAEAGARFQREASGVDPMGWMLAPRSMFDGVAPLDACLERGPFLRGILVHGLGLDLDMDAADLDDLLDEEEEDGHDSGEEAFDHAVSEHVVAGSSGRSAPGGLRLFSAALAYTDGRHTVHAYHASLASDREEMTERLFRRFGLASLDATITDGFDADDPMTESLVAPGVAHTLALVAAAPASPLATGVDLTIEQRFIG